ncbi:DUF397 domain-containing protein [Streptomyces sp. NPDC101227]|uniref:DUF397 domain-containing protein n=1 Tax=Streptomyces sp. NPDC101227 TaxID=3366136 RepID=UPI0037FD74A4
MSRYTLATVQWRKSSYSDHNGGDCIEVGHDFPGAVRWRKSSYSSGASDNCVEVRDDIPGVVPVRDSKDPHGPALVIPAAGWTAFVTSVKNGALHAS